jgi:hypothetical protein
MTLPNRHVSPKEIEASASRGSALNTQVPTARPVAAVQVIPSEQSLRTPPPAGSELVPFFVAPPRSAPARRRMLLVFLEFAPSPSVGTLRWQRLAQFAHDRGWEIDVVMAHPSSLDQVDPRRLADLPPGSRLFGFVAQRSMMERAQLFGWRLFRRCIRPVVSVVYTRLRLVLLDLAACTWVGTVRWQRLQRSSAPHSRAVSNTVSS